MPRLTKEELAQVKYVSMADFFNQLDKYENFSDKLKFTSRYLLTHSSKQNPDYSIEEAIHLAKVKLVDEAEKQHTKYLKENKQKDTAPHIVNPYSRDDKAAEMFMANPVDYLVGEANKTIKELNSENVGIPEEKALEDTYLKTLDSMALDTREKVKALDKNSRVMDMKARMEAKCGGREGLNKAYQKTKGSFISRLFGTSSAAAKNLDQVYNAFNNPNHVLYGNFDALSKATAQYVQHNFPDWEMFMELPTEEEMAHLSATEKDRMRFTKNIINSIKEQANMEDRFGPLVKACEEQNIEYQDIKQVESHKIIDLDDPLEEKIDDDSLIGESEKSVQVDQTEFRQKLRYDLNESEKDSELIDDESEKSIEKEVEEEHLDDLNNSN